MSSARPLRLPEIIHTFNQASVLVFIPFYQPIKSLFLERFKMFGLRLTLWPPNYSIWIFTHLKLCYADAIHNFKWVKIIQIWQMEVNFFQILPFDVAFYLYHI